MTTFTQEDSDRICARVRLVVLRGLMLQLMHGWKAEVKEDVILHLLSYSRSAYLESPTDQLKNAPSGSLITMMVDLRDVGLVDHDSNISIMCNKSGRYEGEYNITASKYKESFKDGHPGKTSPKKLSNMIKLGLI